MQLREWAGSNGVACRAAASRTRWSSSTRRPAVGSAPAEARNPSGAAGRTLVHRATWRAATIEAMGIAALGRDRRSPIVAPHSVVTRRR